MDYQYTIKLLMTEYIGDLVCLRGNPKIMQEVLWFLDDNEEGYDAISKTFYLVKISSKNGLTEQDLEKAKKY